LVNDSSSDNSQDIIKQFGNMPQVNFVNFSAGPSHRENLGVAMSQAKGNIICFFDIDLSCDMASLKILIDAVQQEGFDIAVGNRYDPQFSLKRNLGRKCISKIFNKVARALWRSKISDHQCGFKAMKKNIFLSLLDEMGYDSTFSRRWFWDTELLLRAQKNKYKIKEIPVKWQDRAKEKAWFIFLWHESRIIFYI